MCSFMRGSFFLVLAGHFDQKVANDEQGMDVKVADTEVFYPSDREGFVGALRTQEAAEQRPRDGFEP